MATVAMHACSTASRFDSCEVRLENSFRGNEVRVTLHRHRASPYSRRIVGIRSSSVSNSAAVKYETGNADRVSWAGDGLVSRFVSTLISIKPLYSLMRRGAKGLMVRTAEKNGIPWQRIVEDLRTSDVYAEKDLLENPEISYPDYYLQQFHGYETGNLSWEAAFDVEPATMAMIKRAVPSSSLAEAEAILRGKWLQRIESHHAQFSSVPEVRAILDCGCSTGTSTRSLRDHFQGAEIVGLDLSPYFVAVAQHIEKKEAKNNTSGHRQIRYIHANAEATGLPSKSFDIVSLAFLLHECPRSTTLVLLKEARRLLRPGGTIALIDTSGKSKAIQALPPPIFVLMKSTEPWLDEFFMINLEEELVRIGFANVTSVLTSPRHLTVTATAI